MTDDAAIWHKIDKISDDLGAVRVELGRQDYRVGSIERRVDRVVEKIAEARGEAHNEAVRLADQLDRLLEENRAMREAVNQAQGGLRMGKWIAGFLIAIGALGASIWGAISGGN